MQPVFDYSTNAAGSNFGIKVSEIPNAGQGLHTYNRIREGKTVGEYFGINIDKDFDYGEMNDLIASYSMGNHDDSVIYCAFNIATNTLVCMAGYINDPLDDLKCNVRPVWHGNRCRVVAVRDIEPMEELLMAYGDIFWMRDIWPSELIERAWENYGRTRTNALWRVIYHRRIAEEVAAEDTDDFFESDEDDQSVWEDEREVVFPVHTVREIIDLTQGDEPVIIREPVAVVQEEEPVFIPYTLDSPELYEDYLIVRNSCA
jgi:hypothetical protein